MFNKKILYLFLIVSIFIFIVACDNFNNKPTDETSTNALVIITTSKIEETSLVTIQPTMTPTVKPTSTLYPTNSNTITPTTKPTVTSTSTSTPTSIPTATHTEMPTATQTAMPTATPTLKPTKTPVDQDILSGLKICIDPGHQIKGNYNKEQCAPWSDDLKTKCTSGTTGNFTGVDEYIINLQIAEKIRNKLVDLGADVLMTRQSHEVDISNIERAKMANEYGADITLRIHCNSAASSTAEGIDLFVRGKGTGTQEYLAQSDKDYAIAADLLEYICNATGARKRYVHKTDDYTGINWCENTCIIIECGFLSNEKEDKLLNSAEYQDKIAEGIKNYFVSLH